MTTRLYKNEYIMNSEYGILKIFGGKYSAEIKFSKSDFPTLSKVGWGLMSVGKEGYKILIPYTVVNKKSLAMGKYLMGIDNVPNMRVEHKNCDNLDYQRDNIYVIHKSDFKKKPPRNSTNIKGVYELRQKNGNITGFVVEYKIDGQRKHKYFSKIKYGNLDNALNEAAKFYNEYINIIR